MAEPTAPRLAQIGWIDLTALPVSIRNQNDYCMIPSLRRCAERGGKVRLRERLDDPGAVAAVRQPE